MKKKYGFTMIEILMIALVMGTALIGVLAVMKKMEQSNTKIIDNVIATNLAVQGYELVHAQESDVRYDSLLILLSGVVDNANAVWHLTNSRHFLTEGKYYVVPAKERICTNNEISVDGSIILASGTDLDTCTEGEFTQLRVLLGAVCSGENFKLDENGLCRSGNEVSEDFKEYQGIMQWSGVCLQDNRWVPCTGDSKFHREIIISQDVSRCSFGTGDTQMNGQDIPCEGSDDDKIYRYRYGYNVCSRVFYNWQAGGQSRKKQVAEICAKLN